MKKNTGSLIGLVIGVGAIFGSFLFEGGSLKALFYLPPLIIVFGGTFAAVIIGFGFNKFSNIFTLIHIAYAPKEYDLISLINSIVDFSIISRKEGLLAIEKRIDDLEYVFSKKLLRYIIDGTDAESLQNLAYLEIKSMSERHQSNAFIFIKMGGYAPTMGIIGTVMGLIMTLANAGGNSDLLIKNIASAFIATLWGVFSANIGWLPIGDKLKQCHLQEKQMMEISLEGALSLQSGEIPSVIKAKLIGLLPQKDQLIALSL